jgi:3'-phosphoadenosine 5'-phosphosulfate sulfotransferase (PAPS reductase)/FAD synthetase
MSDDQDRMLSLSRRRVADAVVAHTPTHTVMMVSGGKDSMAALAVAQEIGVKIDLVIHGRTGCGIEATTDFVRETIPAMGLPLEIADAGSAYEDYVLRKGFFGKGHAAHGFAYRILKATPFRAAISRAIRQRRRNIRVMLLNGARKTESANRMARLEPMRADPSRPGNLWVNIIHDWTKEDRDKYLNARAVPCSPVARLMCRSGECMCGTTQSEGDRIEAKLLFPEWGAWMDALDAEARRLHGFGWGEPFPRRRSAQGQGDLFLPLCVDCRP